MIDMRVYGVRPNEKGWRTATSPPYDHRSGTAEEKQAFSGSHGRERIADQASVHATEHREAGLRPATERRDSGRAAGSGQARNPLQR